MPFDLNLYLLVSLIILASSVVQGAVGFASGLFGTPLLMMAGLTLPDAVAVSLVAGAFQNCIAAWQLRREIDYRRAIKPMLIRFALLPLGVLVLYIVGKQGNDLASQLVGAIILAIVAVQQALQVPPQPQLHPAWEWLAFGLGGFLLGLCGMGGPPMMLWALSHDWPMNRTRAFMYFIFVTGLVPHGVLLWWTFGSSILGSMLLGVALFPAVLIGLYLGLALSRVLSDRVLRRLSIAVLVLIAVSAIVSPYLPRLAPTPRPASGSAATFATGLGSRAKRAALPAIQRTR
jgi:uncharacterized membrane protein YfcA